MIIRHDELQLAAKLRSSIISLLRGVTDADGLLPFSDHSPNRVTREKIVEVASQFYRGLLALGAVPIELHADCGRPAHSERASSIGRSKSYWFVSVPGREMQDITAVQDGSGILIMDGRLYTTDLDDAVASPGQSRKGCGCSSSGRQEEHAIGHYIAWPPDPDSSICDLGMIYRQLLLAVEASADKKRRSSIREELLFALLELERLIVPETADEHLAVRHAMTDAPLHSTGDTLSDGVHP